MESARRGGAMRRAQALCVAVGADVADSKAPGTRVPLAHSSIQRSRRSARACAFSDHFSSLHLRCVGARLCAACSPPSASATM